MDPEHESDLTEQLVAREVVRSGKYLTFVSDTVETPDGRLHQRQIALHPGAVTVVAILPGGRVLLVRQYRHAAGRALLELPAGTLDRREDGSLEDTLDAARRELLEETGYDAHGWRRLAGFWTVPGFASEHMTLYLATDLAPDAAHAGADPDERLLVESLTLPELLAHVEDGRIEDAKTIIGVFWLDALVRSGEVALPG